MFENLKIEIQNNVRNNSQYADPHLHSISRIDPNSIKIVIFKSLLIQEINPLSENVNTNVSIWKIFKNNFVGITF